MTGGPAGQGAVINSPLSRRKVLATIAAAPAVLAGVAAIHNPEIGGLPQAGVAAEKIIRGGSRLFNAPWLVPGTRLRLPDGVKALPVSGFFENRPSVAKTTYSWPHVPDATGTVVNASIIPANNAPSRTAILSGFSEGWYELSYAQGTIDRVEWDARRFPYLWYWGEFGASTGLPFMGRFYTLGLEPYSHPPVS